MDKEELLEILAVCENHQDTKKAHGDADTALLAYINDPEITAA